MITFKDGKLLVTHFEKGKDLHVVLKDSGFEYYLTSSGSPCHGFFEVPERLVWTPDFKGCPELMRLFAFLDDLPFE